MNKEAVEWYGLAEKRIEQKAELRSKKRQIRDLTTRLRLLKMGIEQMEVKNEMEGKSGTAVSDARTVPESTRRAFIASHPMCEVCNSREHLHIHHAVPRRLLDTDGDEYLHRLCAICHYKLHGKLTMEIAQANERFIEEMKKGKKPDYFG
jgi:hypothetical protein